MTEKKLTNTGVEDIEKIDGVDEIQEIEYTKKEQEPIIKKEPSSPYKKPSNPYEEDITEEQEPTRKEKKQFIKESNKEPEAKKYGAKVMKKSTYIMIWITIGILISLLVWSNTVFSLKDFSPDNNFTINNDHTINVDSPDVTTPINNNFTIINENKMEIPQDIINNITKEIADKIILELNSTNLTI